MESFSPYEGGKKYSPKAALYVKYWELSGCRRAQHSLPCNGSIASCKASSSQRAVLCCLFSISEYPLSALRSCSSCLYLPSRLPVTFILPSRANASFFNSKYPVYALRSSSSCLHFPSRLPVTSILPSRASASFFKFKYPVSAKRSSSSCLHIPSRLPVTSILPSRASASFFNFKYPVYAVRSSSSCLHLPSRLPVTSILPSIFPSVKCLRRQFLHRT